jgi:hypothetical protein
MPTVSEVSMQQPQVVWGELGPQAFGWSPKSLTDSTPLSVLPPERGGGRREGGEPTQAGHRQQERQQEQRQEQRRGQKEEGSGEVSPPDKQNARLDVGKGAKKIGKTGNRGKEGATGGSGRTEPLADLKEPDLDSVGGSHGSGQLRKGESGEEMQGMGRMPAAQDVEEDSMMLGGGWDRWWDDWTGDLWRGSDKMATGAVISDGEDGNGVQLRIMEPMQGQHIVCNRPACAVPLEFAVRGSEVERGGEVSAVLNVNHQEAARFEDARYVSTNIVDLATSWHTLEFRISVRLPGGSVVELADARMIRIVHLLTSPQRGAVSFGTRGGCRCLHGGGIGGGGGMQAESKVHVDRASTQSRQESPGAGHVSHETLLPLMVSCIHRPSGIAYDTLEEGGEEEELVQFAVHGGSVQADDAVSKRLYEVAEDVAHRYDLGRIEALQIWNSFDTYVSRRLGSMGTGASSFASASEEAFASSALGGAPARRWAVISANGNADYAFYLPIVAYIWGHVVGYNPLVLLVGEAWQVNSRPSITNHKPQATNHQTQTDRDAGERCVAGAAGRFTACSGARSPAETGSEDTGASDCVERRLQHRSSCAGRLMF